MKIRRVGAEFHADRRTDMTKLIVAFRSFAYALKTIFNPVNFCRIGITDPLFNSIGNDPVMLRC